MRTVILVDDHELIRAGLRHALQAKGDFQVIAEAGTARDGWSRAAAARPMGAVVGTSPADVVSFGYLVDDGTSEMSWGSHLSGPGGRARTERFPGILRARD